MPRIRPDRLGWLAAALTLLLAVSARPAAAQDEAYLRIETGVHEAAVNHMARLADGSLLTVSDDKTARIWSIDGLQARDLILPPIGPGDTGALFAVATSAKAIALGGRVRDNAGRFAVALYSQAPLAPAGLLAPFPAPVTALAFSPAGDMLAVGLQGGGVRVVGLTARRMLLQDEHYEQAVTGLAFDTNGRLVAASEDVLRVYEPDMQRSATIALPRGARPYGVAVSPDGRRIAVGDRQRAVVHLVDADRLRPERDLDGATSRGGSLNVVAFAPDGRTLYAAGSYVDQSGSVYIRRWPLTGAPGNGTNGHEAPADLPAARDLVTDLLALDDGVLFATAEPSVGRLGADGHVLARVRSRHIDFRNAGRAGFRLSANGARIRLPVGVAAGAATMPSEQAVVVDIRLRTLSVAPDAGQDLAPPFAAAAGLGITEWQNSRAPRLNGQPIALDPAETVRAVAVQANGGGAALGTDFFVRFVTRQGERWRQPTEAPAWAVNVSADGHWVVAGLGDGTVRWFRAEDGHPGLTLFVDPPTGRFVIWTPEGFFDHDHRDDGEPDGRSLIGYRFNLASARASEFVAIGQLYPRFFRPDLVGMAFRDDPFARSMIAGQASLLGNVRLALSEGLPPAITVLEACALGPDAPDAGCAGQAPVPLDAASAVSAGRLRLRYRLRDPSGHVGSVVFSRNDAVVQPDTVIESADDTTRIEQATMALGRGRTVVALTPVSNTGAVEGSAAGRITLTLTQAPPARAASRGSDTGTAAAKIEPPAAKLYVLSVGVNETGNPDWSLKNAANDARAIADTMRTPVPSVYSAAPDVVSLIDGQATADAILAGLRRIAKLAAPDDIVMIYLAGHGRTVDGRYDFAPYDLGKHDPSVLRRVRTDWADQSVPEAEYNAAADVLFRTEGLSQEQLLATIQTIQATRIAVVLDTCYSATLANEDAVLRRDENTTVTNRIGHASGRFILSGSFELALDGSDDTDGSPEGEGHGLFTSVLLRALQGHAAASADGSGRVDIYKLATFTKVHVVQESLRLQGKVQEPAYYFAGNDFFALR